MSDCVDSAIIQPVHSDSILSSWGSIEPLLQRVLDRVDSGHTVEDVLTKLQVLDMQLWNINNWQAIAVTQISILPLHKVLAIVYVSGESVDDWLAPLVNTLEIWAGEIDCKYVEFYGRDGWRPKAKQVGFDKTFSVMRLRVDGKQRRKRSSTTH